jgi:hypothetical protein
MPNWTPRSVALALSAAMGLSVGVIGTVLCFDSAPNPGSAIVAGYGPSLESAPGAANAPGAAGPRTTTTFSIAGRVGGLFPGKTFPLVLTLTNPLTVAITVRSITTTVSNASTLCVAGDLEVTSFSGHLVVAAGKSSEAMVYVTLTHSASNVCQGARFPLHYLGLATAAAR